jgi:MFS family permease
VPLVAGLFLLPMAVAMAVCAPLAGRMVARRGTRVPLLIAGAGLMAAGVLLTALSAATSAGYLVLSYLVFGIGMGMVNGPITNSAVSGTPREQAGVAAGIASASRQVGQVLGVAVMGSVLTANLHGPLQSGFRPRLRSRSPTTGRGCRSSAGSTSSSRRSVLSISPTRCTTWPSLPLPAACLLRAARWDSGLRAARWDSGSARW